MNLRMIASAAAVAVLVATPAMAAGSKQHSADQTGVTKVKKVQKVRARYGDSYAAYNGGQRIHQRSVAADNWNRTGFWPTDVAAGVVGSAVTTAGVIATAPFSPFLNDSYAYYNNNGFAYDDSYAYYDSPRSRRSHAGYGWRNCAQGTITTVGGWPQYCD